MVIEVALKKHRKKEGRGPGEMEITNLSPRAQNSLKNMKNRLQTCESLRKIT